MKELLDASSSFSTFNFDDYIDNELSGFLKKKDAEGGSLSALLGGGWKECWFVLKEQRLMYYDKEQEKFSFGKGNDKKQEFFFGFLLMVFLIFFPQEILRKELFPFVLLLPFKKVTIPRKISK
jgi:hypothetical protein